MKEHTNTQRTNFGNVEKVKTVIIFLTKYQSQFIWEDFFLLTRLASTDGSDHSAWSIAIEALAFASYVRLSKTTRAFRNTLGLWQYLFPFERYAPTNTAGSGHSGCAHGVCVADHGHRTRTCSLCPRWLYGC